jgi:hypothetical protein
MKAVGLFLLLSPIFSFTQIQKTTLPESVKIGEVKSVGVFFAELSYIVVDQDTVYNLMFKNQKYSSITDIQSIQFSEDGETLGSLYQILNETFDLEKGKHNTFKLGKQDIAATLNKMMGTKYINVMIIGTGAYFNLTKKQLDKLFNKR